MSPAGAVSRAQAQTTNAADAWGGLAATLVAVPAAIGFGVTVYLALGAEYGSRGAVAGILGTAALGLVTALMRGPDRLISAPCAPAAAVLGALAIQMSEAGLEPAAVLLRLALIGAFAGAVQIGFGALHLGRLIKYMPFPVVSGYLSGVGVLIALSQIAPLLGAARGSSWSDLVDPTQWRVESMAIGAAAIAAMLFAQRLIRAVPAPLLALGAGTLVYLGCVFAIPALGTHAENPLVVGAIDTGANVSDLLLQVVRGLPTLHLVDLQPLVAPAVTLGALLSIDTLKTCVVLDAMTRGRHEPDRALIGQGVANLVASLLGGIPGAGTMGATLVNVSSGARTRRSGAIAGGLALAVLLVLSPVIGWLPVAALSGILFVTGLRMIDVRSARWLKSRNTALDFGVIAAVVVTALSLNLIAATAVGVALAVLLFVRGELQSAPVHRKSTLVDGHSKRVRLPAEREKLAARAETTVIVELQGSLFFGTADRLHGMIAADVDRCEFLVLDMRRVQSIDVSAAHLLEQIEDTLAARGATLLYSGLHHSVPSGQNMIRYFAEIGLAEPERHARVFDELSDAVEWIENQILGNHGVAESAPPLEPAAMELFRNCKLAAMGALRACLEERRYEPGARVFARGDAGDELFLIAQGLVRIELPVESDRRHHLATFGRGDFFGEMSFIDQAPRSADAVAVGPVQLWVLTRRRFDTLAEQHRGLAIDLLGGLARLLAERLRVSNAELRSLQA